jgi:peptide/nickel transport system ATP-binding protein
MVPLLTVQELQVSFPDPVGVVVDRISFGLNPGETLGIVGESGSGKSMTALALMRLTPPQAKLTGQIIFRIGSASVDLLRLNSREQQRYRGRHLAIIFQEPGMSLNPLYTCGWQLQETLQQHHALSLAEIRSRCKTLFQEVQLSESLLNRYPHQLSGGQRQRVAIALAIAGDPEVLIADEPTTALDVTLQKEILTLLKDLQIKRGMALMFITHDLALVSEIADQVLVMYRGKSVEQGSITTVFTQPQNPYTRGLLFCRPRLNSSWKRLPTLETLAKPNPHQRSNLGLETTMVTSLSGTTPPDQDPLTKDPVVFSSPLLKVNHLKTYFSVQNNALFLRSSVLIKAVDDVSFSLYSGETLGLVGESGSGKSTLGRTILCLIKATAGEVIYDGDNLLTLPEHRLRPLRKNLQLIFQDPFSALNPRMSVGDAVMEPMRLQKIGNNQREWQQKTQALFLKVGLDPQSLHRFPHEFSGGQRQRICIARALACEPRLIICDEAVSALDVSVQAQILNLLKDLQEEFKLSYLFISHDLSVVQFMSHRIMVMKQGKIEEMATSEEIYRSPKSDYTQKLLAAIPKTSF